MSVAISTIPTASTSNLGRDGRNRELARATAIAKRARDWDCCQEPPLKRGDEAKFRSLPQTCRPNRPPCLTLRRELPRDKRQPSNRIIREVNDLTSPLFQSTEEKEK